MKWFAPKHVTCVYIPTYLNCCNFFFFKCDLLPIKSYFYKFYILHRNIVQNEIFIFFKIRICCISGCRCFLLFLLISWVIRFCYFVRNCITCLSNNGCLKSNEWNVLISQQTTWKVCFIWISYFSTPVFFFLSLFYFFKYSNNNAKYALTVQNIFVNLFVCWNMDSCIV